MIKTRCCVYDDRKCNRHQTRCFATFGNTLFSDVMGEKLLLRPKISKIDTDKVLVFISRLIRWIKL